MNIKFSVITPTYNSEKHLFQSLDSLYSQTYDNFEHIIYDSCSTDKTKEIINIFKDHRTTFVQKKDKGIFEALNSCLDHVTGDLIFLLCSDDYLLDKDIFERVSKIYQDSNDVIATTTQLISLKGKILRRWKPPLKIYNSILPSHVGLFIGSDFKDYKFDLKYKIASDFKYLRSIFYSGRVSYKIINTLSVNQRNGGNSTDLSNYLKKMSEDIKILNERHLIFKSLYLYTLKIFYKFSQYI